MAALDKQQPKFERQATCASCHNQIQPMVAASVIKTKGMPINDAVYTKQVAMSAEVIRRRHDYSLAPRRLRGGEHALVTSPTLVGLAEVKFPADENTDVAVILSPGQAIGRRVAAGRRGARGYRTSDSNFDQADDRGAGHRRLCPASPAQTGRRQHRPGPRLADRHARPA